MSPFVFLLIPFAIIAVVILLIVGIKTKSEKEGDDLMKNIFVYLVLFATLMMTIGGSVGAFMAAADIISPAPYHQSFEQYAQWSVDYNDEKILSQEELKEQYDAMVKNDKEQAKQRSINTLIKSLGWVIIPLPIFLYFQRKLQRKN